MKINFSRASKVFTASLMALIASSVLVAGSVTAKKPKRTRTKKRRAARVTP